MVGVGYAINSEITHALRAFMGLNKMSNYEISVDHFVIFPTIYGLNNTYFKGWSLQTTNEWLKNNALVFLMLLPKLGPSSLYSNREF